MVYFEIIVIPLILGAIVGIKCTLLVEILVCAAVALIMYLKSVNKEMEGIFYYIFAMFFIVGTLVGDVYVLFAYPDIRELFFTRVSDGFKWLTSPPGK